MDGVLTQTVREIRIGIIGVHIQTFVHHPVVVQISEHAVCGDKILRFFIFSDNVTLYFAELYGTGGYKSGVIQDLMGIVESCTVGLGT